MEICDSRVSRDKKMKIENDIGLLPDAVLHHILSFLDMKYVTRTSVLATGWRYLWRSVPTLNFSFSIFCGSDPASTDNDIRFMNFIDQVLIHRDISVIEKFFLEYSGEFSVDEDVTEVDENLLDKMSSWVFTSVRYRVQAFDLQVSYKCKPSLTLCLMQSESLVSLKLSTVSSANPLIMPQSITFSLPRLKYLHLTSVKFPNNNSTTALFANRPVIESIDLINCDLNCPKTFSFSVPSVKHLGIDCLSYSIRKLNICAPNLTSLYVRCDLDLNFSIASFSPLTTAELDLSMWRMSFYPESFVIGADFGERERAQHMIRLLNSACNLKTPTLSASALMVEIISAPSSLVESLSTQFLDLRIMHLKSWLYGECIVAIVHLLRLSPNVERLTVDLVKKNSNLEFMDDIPDENMEKAKLICNEEFVEIGRCMLYHLKYVKIEGVEGWANELKFLEILLRSSVVLEKVVIFTAKTISPDSEERLNKFSEKVHAFPSLIKHLPTTGSRFIADIDSFLSVIEDLDGSEDI